jgi:SAM-dependent methyltransferase
MERFYDKVNNRLVYMGKSLVTQDFWDQYWKKGRIETVFENPPKYRLLLRITKKYLPLNAKILEGGCGMGSTVFALNKAGFNAYGVDFAQKTIHLIQKNWPHLKVSYGDVRSLPFPDNFFDGYWSIGVIEHFYGGYEEIMNEMYRVIKPGGYLFLSFPAMTIMRKNKAEKNQYPPFDESKVNLDKFYQFALDPDDVRIIFEKRGFQVVKKCGQYSLVGLKNEVETLKPLANFLSKLPMGFWTKINIIFDPILGNFSGHTYLLILKNSKK